MALKYKKVLGTGGLSFGPDASFLTMESFLSQKTTKTRLKKYAAAYADKEEVVRLGRLKKPEMLRAMAELAQWAKLKKIAQGEASSEHATFKDARRDAIETLKRIGFLVEPVSLNRFAPATDVLKRAAMTIVLEAETPALVSGVLTATETVRGFHVYLDSGTIKQRDAIAGGLSKDQVDAKYTPWEELTKKFNDRSVVYQSVDNSLDPNVFRPVTPPAFKKAITTGQCEVTKVMRNCYASGNHGTANLEGNASFFDHANAEWLKTTTNFGDFSKHSRYKPQVLDYIYQLVKAKPSMYPYVVRFAEQGLDGNTQATVGAAESSNARRTERAKRLKKKRKKSADDAKEEARKKLSTNMDAESYRAHTQSLNNLLNAKHNEEDETIKQILQKKIKYVLKQMRQYEEDAEASDDDDTSDFW